MVDFQSQRRIHFSGPTTTEIREPLPSFRLYNSEFVHRKFKHYHPPAHQCRLERFREREERPHWPVFLLSFGLKETYASVAALNAKPDKGSIPRLKCWVGKKGFGEGEFEFPRSVSTLPNSDVVVADCENHRIQIFNNAGIFKVASGSKGNEKGQFQRPIAVVGLPNGSIAVADSYNRRIQILRGRFAPVRFCYPTNEIIACLTCDENNNVYAFTCQHSLLTYSRTGQIISQVCLSGAKKSGLNANSNCKLAVHTKHELALICDPLKRIIYLNNFKGQLVQMCRPLPCLSGLTMHPIGLAVNHKNGRFVIGDSLNHTINEYVLEDNHFHLVRCLLGPSDSLGSFQDFSLSWDGSEIACCEFVINSDRHQLKIFGIDPEDPVAKENNNISNDFK